MAFKFCPECGSRAEPGGLFCSACGASLRPPRQAAPLAGVAALAVLLLAGGGFWLEYRHGAAEPARPLPGAPSARGQSVPPGHPPFQMPDDIRRYIAKLADEAKAKPEDAAAWSTYARVAYRASRLDPSYRAQAKAAFEHLHQIAPRDLVGLRGLGNVAYDEGDRKSAIRYYRAYLEIEPDDPEVRTDLGTMYFESGEAEKAIAEYERVIAKTPAFYQAYFNLAVVYDAQGKRDDAHAQLEKARDLATDADVKKRIAALLDAARKNGVSLQEAARIAANEAAPPAGAGAATGAAQPAAPAAGGDTFAAAVEALFRRAPVAGPKVAAVVWPDPAHVRVEMANFPMKAMPEAMRSRFLDRLAKGVADARRRFDVEKRVTVEIVDQKTGEVMERFES